MRHTTVPLGIVYPATSESTKALWSTVIGAVQDNLMTSATQASESKIHKRKSEAYKVSSWLYGVWKTTYMPL